jgi:hypothetical protein
MKNHRLALLMVLAAWLSAHAGTMPASPPSSSVSARPDTGYLVVPQADARGNTLLRVVPYQPQPGDILLYHLAKYETLFQLAGSGGPMHAAIVFARPDGTPASLELTGPEFWLAKVRHLDIGPRLHGYPGAIMARRPRVPLTPAQSAALTRFALAQEGKDFALGRLALQATPFRCRAGLRQYLFGHTYLDRSRWICSEIVIAAAANAGMIDPKAYPANAMYPRDLAYDETYNLSAAFQAPVLWVPSPRPVMQGNRVWQ